MTSPLAIDGNSLTLGDVVRVARQRAAVTLSDAARGRMLRIREVVERMLAAGETLYGVNTGFGKLSDVAIPPDRLADLQDPRGDMVLLRPSRDETLGPGGTVTMSDDKENSHWLIAEADRSFTFDVGVLTLSKTRNYILPANEYSMIFVDPTPEQDGYGLITAPVLTFEKAVAKFA